MEKEGRGQERPQSWKCSSVGMGSKMEVVLPVLQSATELGRKENREGSGSGVHARIRRGAERWGPEFPTHLLAANEGELSVQSTWKSNLTLSPEKELSIDTLQPFLSSGWSRVRCSEG